MSIITLSSDLGINNFEIATLEAQISSAFPHDKTIHLYHQSDNFDIESIGYNLYSAIVSCPPDTIHIALCKYSIKNNKIVVAKIKNQYIVTTDNGVFSLIHPLDFDAAVFAINYEKTGFNLIDYIQIFIQSVQHIKESGVHSLQPYPIFAQIKPFNTDLIVSEKNILCRVIYINELGNVTTNLRKEIFEKEVNTQAFYIKIVTTKIRKISISYSDIDINTRLGAIFNSAGFLEIFISGSHLAHLYNINKYSNNRLELVIEHDTHRQINF